MWRATGERSAKTHGTFWRRCALILGFVALVGSSRAGAVDTESPPADFTITSWGLDDGLPSLRVWSIAQDPEGYLWLGTDAGLVRFDGVRFHLWAPIAGPHVQKGAVTTVYSARDGGIWVGQGPAGDGVSRIVNGRVENYGRAGLADAVISLLLEDRTGVMWTGNDDGLFQLQDHKWKRLTDANGVPRVAVYSGYEDSRGDLWIGTNKGVLRRKNGTSRFEVVNTSRQSVQGFAEDPAGTLWVTDAMGLQPLNGQRERGAALPSSGNKVLRDSRGDFWVATLDQGLWRVRRERDTLIVLPLSVASRWPNDVVRALYEDRDGNIWVAADSGLYRFTPRKVTTLTDVGRSRLVATTPDGSVWIGTAARLVRLHGDSRRFYGLQDGLSDSGITALSTDRGGVLWVATSRYIAKLENDRFVPVTISEQPRLSNIRALSATSSGTLWIHDNDEGLFTWNGNRLTPFVPPSEVRGRRVRSLFIDSHDRAWISFTGGHVLTVMPTGSFELHQVLDEHGLINAIYEGRDGKIWMGGIQGLSRIDGGRIATLAQTKLPGYAVFSIVEDADRNLWIGCALGIARIREAEFDRAVASPDYQPHYEMYDASDGLAGMPLWFGIPDAVENAGKLWFVTTGGMTVIDPSRRDLRPPPPKVRIDIITANGRPVQLGAAVAFPADVRNLMFEYTVPNLTSPTKVTFRHRLTNVDTDWVDTGARRDVSYANLSPGNYKFEVVAVSSDRGWNESAASWVFSIQPMFYETGWFFGLCAISAAGLAGLLWRLRVRRLRRQFALVLAERARMSREIHDTLLQGMVGVALQFNMLSETVGHASPPLVEHLVRLRKQVEEYIRETREAIFDLRVPRSERDVAELLREAGTRITAGANVQFNVAVSGQPRPAGVNVDRQLLQVAREAITNSVRHAQADRIQVKVDYRADSLFLRVSDDGHGFDVEQATRHADGHFGLQTMRERAQQVGGKVRISSSLGMGTDIEVTFPLPVDI